MTSVIGTDQWFLHVLKTFYNQKFKYSPKNVDAFLKGSIEFSKVYCGRTRTAWCDALTLALDAFMKVLAYKLQHI